jgi:thiazole synthase
MESPMSSSSPLTLYGETFTSRLLLGTSRYPSPSVLLAAIERAQPAMLTASLRRQTGAGGEASQSFWNLLREAKVPVLPNTAGCHSMQEAITTAEMAREVFNTDWIKLELIGDDYTLQPDTLNLPEAASRLIKAGFKVLPYCTEDLVLCQRLVDVGCQAVMPWAAPIGTGKGPVNPTALRTLQRTPFRSLDRRCRLRPSLTRMPSHGMGLRRGVTQYRCSVGTRPCCNGRRIR